MKTRVSSSILAALALSLTAVPAWAFVCIEPSGGTPTPTWYTRQVDFVANPNLAELYDTAETDLQRSFAEWTGVSCSDMSLRYTGTADGVTAGFQDGGPNQNVLVHILRDEWPHDRSALALTTPTFRTNTGELLDADVEFNERFLFLNADVECNDLFRQQDLENTLTHELGHVIGLNHPDFTQDPSLAEATMAFNSQRCETSKRSLESDDISGICTIYPSGEDPAPCIAPPPGAFDTDDGGCRGVNGSPGTLPVFVLLAGFMLGARRRRRAPR